MNHDWLARYDLGIDHPYANNLRNQYRWLRRSERSSPSEVREYQFERVKRIYSDARNYTTYFGKLYADCPAELTSWDQFYELPVMKRDSFPADLSERTLAKLPPGVEQHGIVKTSGSTGVRVEAIPTSEATDFRTAIVFRDMAWMDVDPGWATLFIRTLTTPDSPDFERVRRGVALPAWDAGVPKGMILTGRGYYIDTSASSSSIADAVHRCQPQMIVGVGTVIAEAARLLPTDSPARKSVLAIRSFADTLTQESRNLIEETFSPRIQDNYSCAEVNSLATTAPDGDGLLVHDENVVIEVVRDDYSRCGYGESGKVLVTNLHTLATPFIRYDIGDQATLRPPSGGYGLNRLNSLIGRIPAIVRTPGPERHHAGSLFHVLNSIEGLRECVIRQSSVHRLEVILTLKPGAPDKVTLYAHDACKAIIGDSLEVTITVVDELPRTREGKIRKFEWTGPTDGA